MAFSSLASNSSGPAFGAEMDADGGRTTRGRDRFASSAAESRELNGSCEALSMEYPLPEAIRRDWAIMTLLLVGSRRPPRDIQPDHFGGPLVMFT